MADQNSLVPEPGVTSPEPSSNALRGSRPRNRLVRLGLVPLAVLACVALAIVSFPVGIAQLKQDRKGEARAVIHLSSKPPTILPNAQVERAWDFGSFAKTQAALVKSRSVLTAALRNPKIAELSIVKREVDPVEWLEDMVEVDFQLSPELMRVSLRGEKPQETISLLNAIVDAYLQEVNDTRAKDNGSKIQALRPILTQYEDMLRVKRNTLKQLANAAGGGDGPSTVIQQQILREDWTEYAREKRRVQIARVAARSELRARAPAGKASLPVDEAGKKLTEKITAYEFQMNELDGLIDQSRKVLRDSVMSGIDVESVRDDLDKIEGITKKLRDLIETLAVETSAPPGIRLQERADWRHR